MPPFRYSEFNPNTSDIAHVLGLQGQIAAQAELRRAAAMRENADRQIARTGQTGAILANTANQITGNIGDILQMKREAPIRALQAQDLQNRVAAGTQDLAQKKVSAERAVHLRKTLGEAIGANTTPEGVNHEGVIDYLQKHDAVDVIDDYVELATKEDALANPKPTILAPGTTALGRDNKPLFTAPNRPVAPTSASLAVDAANPDSPTSQQSAAALEKLQGAQAETARHNTAMEQIGRLQAGRAGAVASETARHNRAMEAAGNPLAAIMEQPPAQGPSTGAPAQPATPAAAAAQGVTGDAFLAHLPAPIASEVKAYAEGRRPFPTGFALKSPYFQSLIQMVGQYDPSFDAANFNARNKTRSDFSSPNGAAAKNIIALNTVVGHIHGLSQKAKALNNSDLQPLNAVKNWVKTKTGQPEVVEFETLRKGVTDELTRVWRQSGGAVSDIKAWTDTLSDASSPSQLTGVFSTMADMLESRLDALASQRDQVLGPHGKDIAVVTPQSRKFLDALKVGNSVSAAPTEGTEGTVNGVPAVWKTVGGKAGWYAK